MPNRDRTGPGGRGAGRGGGRRRGGGRGMGGGNKAGAGPGGKCICPSCGEKLDHKIGVPCFTMDCPKCGAKMYRE